MKDGYRIPNLTGVRFEEVNFLDLKSQTIENIWLSKERAALCLSLGWENWREEGFHYEIFVPTNPEDRSYGVCETFPILKGFSEFIGGYIGNKQDAMAAITGKYGASGRFGLCEVPLISSEWRDLKWNFRLSDISDSIGSKIVGAQLSGTNEGSTVNLHIFIACDDEVLMGGREDFETGSSGNVLWKYFYQLSIEFDCNSNNLVIIKRFKEEEWVKELNE